MKTRKKYYVAEFTTDQYFMDDEYEFFYAESAEEVEREMRELFGKHLISCHVRKATWKERRYCRKTYKIARTA